MTLKVSLPEALFPQTGVSPPSAAELALVRALEGGRAALPVLPDVAARALELANDPDASVRGFAALIEKDPPIAARFVAAANSAVYSRGTAIRSVTEAVGRVGLSSARDLIFQVVYATSTSGISRYRTEVQQSFRRSVLSGLISRVAASVLGLDLEDAYLCGLLHDIGESRVYRILSQGKVRASRQELLDLVRRYHARAGAELCVRWALPDPLIAVCRRHHDEGPTPDARLRIVRLADALVAQILDPRGMVGSFPEELLSDLDVPASSARTILERGLREVGRL